MATQWISSLSPPPGENVNFINPVNQLGGNIALHTVCLTLATAGISMRICTRKLALRAALGVDDYFCMVSYCLTIAFSAMMIESYTWGIGRHMWDEPLAWLDTALKYFTIAGYLYLPLTGTVKLAFLFFYYRLFLHSIVMKRLVTGGIIFVVMTTTTVLFLTVFSCKPVSHAWNELGEGTCWDPIILPYLSGSLSVSTDLYVLILPMRPLFGLQMTVRQKFRLITVFGLGIFACVASIVRLGQTHILTESPDATWQISRIGIWATIEVNTGILVSCLQLFPKFLDWQFPKGVFSFFRAILTFQRGDESRDSRNPSLTAALTFQNTKPYEIWDNRTHIELGSRENLQNMRSVV